MSGSIALLAVALCAACSASDGDAAQPAAAEAAAPAGCLASGDGYLRARLRGAADLDINWTDAEMECDGGPRPDGSALRVMIAGPVQSDGRRLRFVFGIEGATEGQAARQRPTNLTVMFEGESRIFATQGEDRCMVDELEQQRLGDLGGPRHSWRVEARGFCIDPAPSVGGTGRLLVTSFDFAGKIVVDDPVDDANDAT
jgi:hypothetical protein